MNCQCCCTNTLKYCEQDVCSEIDFDIKAQVPGTHKLITHFLNIRLIIEAEFAVNEQVIFPLDGLNENYEYTVELYDPLGAKILIRKDSVDYDCFKFKTVLQKTLSLVES